MKQEMVLVVLFDSRVAADSGSIYHWTVSLSRFQELDMCYPRMTHPIFCASREARRI